MKRILFVVLFLASCTEQQRARSVGGKAAIILPAGKKLVNVTWKEASLWYVTRPMRPDEQPEEYQMVESSSWGAFEGTVVLKERR